MKNGHTQYTALMPQLGCYFAMSLPELEDLVSFAQGLTPTQINARLSFPLNQVRPGFERVGPVAVIAIEGFLQKNADWLMTILGGTSSAAAAQAVDEAVADPNIQSILLRIDSPGGSVAGVSELADSVFAGRKAKQVIAFIEDLGASAAFWVASQAEKVFSGNTALVGSIGTYMAIRDLSGAAAHAGVKIHIVKAGDFKGAAVPGTEVTDAHLADFERVIISLNEQFIKAVARGRGMSIAKATKLADGRIHIAADALGLHLIDGIARFDAVLADLVAGRAVQAAGARRGSAPRATASATTTTPAPTSTAATPTRTASEQARLAGQLKAAMPDSDAEFRESCIEAGCTLEVAKGRWVAAMKRRLQLQSKSQEIESMQSQFTRRGAQLAGTRMNTAASDGAGDYREQWDDAIQKEVDAGKTRLAAVKNVDRRYPGLREAMVAEHNDRHPGPGARR